MICICENFDGITYNEMNTGKRILNKLIQIIIYLLSIIIFLWLFFLSTSYLVY